MKTRNHFRPNLESLDQRVLPSITLSNGLLSVGGTAGNDVIRVSSSGGQLHVSVSSTGESRSFALGQVNGLTVGCGAGDDSVMIKSNVSLSSTVRGGRGRDTVNGGSGDDNISGGAGDDSLNGRGGRDRVSGDDGNDSCSGGDGDDSINGGNGRDSCRGGSGNNSISNGFDPDTELLAIFSGGQGSAEFKFGPDDGGIEREFEVEIEDLAGNTTYGVFVDGVSVGSITTNSIGDGRLEYEVDFDSNNDGNVNFPAGFPEIGVGDVVTVQLGGTVVRQGTFSQSFR